MTIDRVKRLQNSIGWLDNYETPVDEIHHIGPNINTINVKESKLLRELGKINTRKKIIINELMSIEC